MALSKKRTPVGVPDDMKRSVDKIYDDLNDIINSVNSYSLSGNEYLGKPGDIRTIAEQQSDGTIKYFVQVKSTEGWVKIEGVLVG